MRFIVVGMLLVVSYSLGSKIHYEKYSVYSLSPKSEEVLEKIINWSLIKNCDFWTPATMLRIPIDVMVPPNIQYHFEKLIQSLGVEYTVKIKNVQELINRSELRKSEKKLTFSWDAYYTLDEINAWLKSLVTQSSDKVTLFSPGKTYEQRELLGVKVSFSPNNSRRGIFIESNIHAREWISHAVSTFILNEVLTSTNDDFRRVVELFDWYVLPVANPDGFAYTHSKNRLWRKTRVPYGLCFGADPNRNWDSSWNQGGASNNPCTETYAGPKAFSEPSTAALSAYLSTISNNLIAYIDFHSYSQLLMVPFGNTTAHLDNYNVTYPLGLKAAKALARRYGTQYEVGNIAETIYVATGGSIDWVKDALGVPYSYVYELRDTGRYGFVLPPELIIPTAEETLDSLLEILHGILSNEGIRV